MCFARRQSSFNPWAAINEGYLAGCQAASVPEFKWIYLKVTEIFVGWQRGAKFYVPRFPNYHAAAVNYASDRALIVFTHSTHAETRRFGETELENGAP